MSKTTQRMNVAVMIAATMGAFAGSGVALGESVTTERRARTHVPMMVTSSPAEIAAWNEAIEARKSRKPRLSRRWFTNDGQHPKFAKARVHKQHKHQLRDGHGAYTLTGNNPFAPRRMWLAGISAQRGY